MGIEQKVTDHEYPLKFLSTEPMFGTVLFTAGYANQDNSYGVPFPYEDMRVVEAAPQSKAMIRVRTTEIELSGFTRVLALGIKRRVSTTYTLTVPKGSDLLETIRKADKTYVFMQMERNAALAAMTGSQ